VAQRSQRELAAFGVDVHGRFVGPSLGDRLGGLGDVLAERAHVLFGEHRLQRPPAWKP
jgi:hypothetical protein